MTDDTPDSAAEPPRAEQQPGGERRRPEGRRRGAGLHPIARAGFLEFDRVLFFSDAVFAIAITLLAVELHVPSAASKIATSKELYHARYSLIAFGISFAVIALFWLGHHGIFRYITAFDRPLISLNLLFLGTIAFLPYPTALLSAHSLKHREAVIFYAICTCAAGLGESAIWLYATRRGSGLTDSSVDGVRLQYTLRIIRVPIVFAISIPIAVVAPVGAPYIWILIFITGLAINRFVPHREPPEQIGEEIRG